MSAITANASISAGPLLQDFMGKDYVSGTGNVALDLTSAGGSVAELKRALNGTASFALQNGAVKGFNLAQIVRQAQAMAGGQPAPQDAPQQTDFTAMSASGKLSNGVLHSDDLTAASPFLRLSGSGQVDLAANTIDYDAKPTLVNTSGGEGGKSLLIGIDQAEMERLGAQRFGGAVAVTLTEPFSLLSQDRVSLVGMPVQFSPDGFPELIVQRPQARVGA